MKPKVLAYYLPAYHQIPENDEWYGKGFTEWDTTKKGKKYCKHQYQPRVPLNQNYYDLSDINHIKWQSELAKKYGVDGFCFYHYWFNGRKILEKPAEMLLCHREIDISFCFAWANEEWRNTWNDKTGDFELLIEQRYDNPNDWVDHFNYLLPFFNDERYIKLNNKPVFMIYRIERIEDFEEKFNIWNTLAKESGFDGIYLIQMINHDKGVDLKSECIDAKVDFEPNKTVSTKQKYAVSFWRVRRVLYNKFVKKNFLHKYFLDIVDYKKFCKSLLKKKYLKNPNYLYSTFVDWDNTARKQKRGLIFKNSKPKYFGNYFSHIYSQSAKEGKPFIFIFAWNEWGEGAYLEPDEKNKFAYIDCIRKVIDDNESKN